MIIRRIEHLCEDVCIVVLNHGLIVIALREELHIEILYRLSLPQPQNGDSVAVLARNHHIVGHGLYVLTVDIVDLHAVFGPLFLHFAAETDEIRFIRTLRKPCLAAGKPDVGQFCLPAVYNLLFEQTIFIPQRVSHCGVIAGCKRIHKACSQPAQTTITQTCVRFKLI